MSQSYEFIGHGTLIYFAGDDMDSMYAHEITSPHNESGDWETFAFIPHYNQESENFARRIALSLTILAEIEEWREGDIRERTAARLIVDIGKAIERNTLADADSTEAA